MPEWSADERDDLGRANEIELSTARVDESLRTFVPVWPCECSSNNSGPQLLASITCRDAATANDVGSEHTGFAR
jgi:hypothetical protein